MNEWKQTWEELPELDRECLGIVNGEYKLIHLTTETDDWESGGNSYVIWVSTDGYGDIVEHYDVSMWKYLEDKPKAEPMPYHLFYKRCKPSSSSWITSEQKVSDDNIREYYKEYLKEFDYF